MRNTRIRLAIFTLATFGVGAAGIVALVTFGSAEATFGADDKKADAKELAHKAYAVLEKNCAKCHHGKAQKGNSKYDVLDWSSVTAAAPSAKVLAKQEYAGAAKYIDSAKPEKSLILLALVTSRCPPAAKG